MSNFIDIADTSGKHWCINTKQILYVEDKKGQTAFYVNSNPEPIISYLKYDSVLALLQSR